MENEVTLVQLTILTCEWCGKPLPAGRSHRKTHNGCRQKLHRWIKAQNRHAAEAMTAIEMIGNYLNFPQTREAAIVHCEQIERMLTEAYRKAGIARRSR